jgi:hypothetical protein
MNHAETIDNALTAKTEQKLSAAEMRSKIMRLETEILKFPQATIKTTHHFAPGVYMREVFIPKDTVVTGAIHKTEHLNILSQGEISVWTEDGLKRIKASSVIPSKPGIKRAGYAHEDSVWITICHNPTNENDTEKLENILTTNSFDEFLQFMEQQNAPKLLTEGEK